MRRHKSREHERLKPRPRSDKAITLTKESVATSQLMTAISLWFQNGDPISILMLAANAHEIFHVLGERVGKPSQLQTWLESMPESFQARMKYVINFCKHGWKDVGEETPHDPRISDVFIYFAGRCYRAVIGNPPAIMMAFEVRLALESPDLAVVQAMEPVSKLRNVYNAAGITRQEFLDEYLPLIEIGRRIHSGNPPESEKP